MKTDENQTKFHIIGVSHGAQMISKSEPETTLRANIPETPVVLLINEQGEKEKGRDER